MTLTTSLRNEVKNIMEETTIDRIVGQPTTETVDNLEIQCAEMCASVETTEWGGEHGHLAMAIDEDDYRTLSGDATFHYRKLANPGNVDPTIDEDTTEFETLTKQAAQAIKIKEWRTADAVESIGVRRIIANVESQYIEEIKEDFIGYNNATIRSMITHLRDEWCIVTTGEKKSGKALFYEPWNQVDHITTYYRRLDEEQKKLKKMSITLNESEKVQQFVEQMYDSDMFDEKEMLEWETTHNKSWNQAKTFFTKLYKQKIQYSKLKGTREFGSANQVREQSTAEINAANNQAWTAYTDGLEASVAESTEKIQNMSVQNNAVLDLTKSLTEELKQQRKQTAAAMEQNRQLIAAMAASTNNPIVKDADIQTAPPRGERKKALCPHCKQLCFHAPDKCRHLEKNKEHRTEWDKKQFNLT
jgi:hypothetical protein